MNIEEAFGSVLKAARNEKELSQEQLALNCDLDRTFISLLERGLRQPSLSSIISLSKALDIPADQLVKKTLKKLDNN